MRYFSSFTISDDFYWNNDTCEEKVLKILLNIESSKPAGVDRPSVSFLKDSPNILAKPICALCSLAIP